MATSCSGASCDFERDYEIAQAPLMREIEQRVRGSDYGGTSWTTREQAAQAARRLALVPGLRLLDVGAGSGWPGLFLAATSGCEVVLADLPLSGLRIARQRAARDGMDGRASMLAANGAALPFTAGSFDRLHHADVLCCMDRKREMLLECRRVLRAEGLMEFSVISLVRPVSTAEEGELMRRSGPAFPDAGEGYAMLLAETGWRVREHFDVTAEFLRCMDVLLEASCARRDALVELLGPDDCAERTGRRLASREAIARGLLKREIFVASR